LAKKENYLEYLCCSEKPFVCLEIATVSVGTSSVIDHIEVFLKEMKEVKQTLIILSVHITFV
jgi:acyl-CoA hydrolase